MIRLMPISVLFLLLLAVPAGASERTYTAVLKPNYDVFPIDSRARGVAKLALSADGQKLFYEVKAFDIGLVSQVHLHVGPVAVTLEGRHSHLSLERGHGPTIADLVRYSQAGVKSGGIVAKGALTAADLYGELKGYPLSVLADHLDRGWIYVNVHIFDERRPGHRICCPSGVNGTVLPD